MKPLPTDLEVSRANPAPARRRARTGDMSASVETEIGSLTRRLAAAQEGERAASVLLANRLSDVKRLAGAAARAARPASIEARVHAVGTGEAGQKPAGKPCCRFSRSGGTRRSPRTVTACDRSDPPTGRWPRHNNTSPRGTAWWLTSISKNSCILLHNTPWFMWLDRRAQAAGLSP
jgi:hypothetical protein